MTSETLDTVTRKEFLNNMGCWESNRGLSCVGLVQGITTMLSLRPWTLNHIERKQKKTLYWRKKFLFQWLWIDQSPSDWVDHRDLWGRASISQGTSGFRASYTDTGDPWHCQGSFLRTDIGIRVEVTRQQGRPCFACSQRKFNSWHPIGCQSSTRHNFSPKHCQVPNRNSSSPKYHQVWSPNKNSLSL